MNLTASFEEILMHCHYWRWAPDWQIAEEVYKTFPDSYSVLTPFAYSYLEELIRSTTSDYTNSLYDVNGKIRNQNVGLKLIKLAIEENSTKSEYVQLLTQIKDYFKPSDPTDNGDNRHSVAHGYMHPKFWSKESFEKLIFDIASISKFAGF